MERHFFAIRTFGSCSVNIMPGEPGFQCKIDGPVKSMFSRKDAKDAKKRSFNIKKLTLRALCLCVSPAVAGLTFYECIKIESRQMIS